MTRHRAVLEAGPGTIRRLCCGTGEPAEENLGEVVREALAAVDDRVALVDGRPVTVDSLWCVALRSVKCADGDGLLVVHPSWWPSARVDRVARAAKTFGSDAMARHRSWLLARAPEARSGAGAVVTVEIAERLVAITGSEVAAIPRVAEPHSVANEVVTLIAGMSAAVVVIDAPGTVAGAPALAALIAAAVRKNGRTAVEIGDARLARLAQAAASLPDDTRDSTGSAGTVGVRSRARTAGGLAAAALLLTVLPMVMSGGASRGGHGPSPSVAVSMAPTTFLVEGRVALTVPANWSAQRVITGPGSARVQVTSPSDPEVALHVTQSPVPGETLSGTAERLKRAIDAEPTGVFVDFNPTGSSAGRPAVTYREMRATHHVRWTVLLDGPVRISVGCQSRPADEGAVRDACEQAVRSAHAIG
ncbi:type VII secretion-associated protein [Mycobacterium paraense]|uniref:type VII secretion-associated protein n=1 Tax=Mycobacterium paraense TaxID=767916 RepID=UPI000A159E4A|nr:type VII secretion-associated protein [Mycobacterium paraense]MCV7444751.1 type VII secretion-associated protein [Mycobacterium paraense]ORW49144.1 Type VII secretion-associated protein [Mycobacterium paraense]